MSRIDANVAAVAADVSRPAQVVQDGQAQRVQAQAARLAHEAPTPISADDVRAVAARLTKVIEAAGIKKVAYQIDKGTGDVFIEVRDDDTDQVIRQIPSEEILRLREAMDHFIGLLFDRKA